MAQKKSSIIYMLSVLLVFAALLLVSCSDKGGENKNSEEKKDTVSTKCDKSAEKNPLLCEFDTPFNVPPFDKIKEEHYMPAFNEAIAQHKKEIDAIVNNTEEPTFENTVEALDRSGRLLNQTFLIFNNQKSACSNEKIREIDKEVAPLMAKHGDDINLNEKLFARIKAVHDKKDTLKLEGEQAMLLDKYYKNFVRGGANLPPEKKEKLRAINAELAPLGVKFGENVLNENNKFEMVLDKKEDLAGLPQSAIDAAAEAAKEKGHEGKWMFTLHKPSLIPFLQYSSKRDLREKMFKGYITRGDHNDELDNKTTLAKIVELRIKRAKLMGFESHAHFVLEPNMAKTPDKVYELLNKLWKAALPIAKKEAEALQSVIDKEGGKFKLQPWDWWYYAEKLRKEKYDLDDNLLRPYFKLENVRDGAFYVANKLWGLKFVERKDLPKPHPDATAFEVQEADGTHIGILYVDYFPRASKRGGAWMNPYRKQCVLDGKNITPVITNVGNFSKPTADKPSLLTFEEVTTLFHEFGHGLHGLLSKCKYRELSGTDVALDFVELPSQIMENWAGEPEVMKIYAKHYKTGEVIPQELIDKIKTSGHFNQGFATTEYLAAALLDMDWHTLTEPGTIDVNKFETDALNKIGLIPEIVVRYRSTYFSHIFSGMYSSGYYSYIWAGVLDADAFEAFKETSLFDQKTAKLFRENVLQRGGTEDPMTLYKRFRGAEPKIDALLKQRGLK